MQMTHEFLLQLVGIAVTGGAIYGGIRGDLKAMHEKMDALKARVDEAHSRMDRILDRRSIRPN
jgi:hypothetical protein